jgi:hypothetical protein
MADCDHDKMLTAAAVKSKHASLPVAKTLGQWPSIQRLNALVENLEMLVMPVNAAIIASRDPADNAKFCRVTDRNLLFHRWA